MCFPAREIERDRLATIAATWRLIGARRIPINVPSEWTGWQVFDPAADRRRYAERAAAGLCTRCGKCPPRPDGATCERVRGSRGPCDPNSTGGATGSARVCSTCAATRQPRRGCAPSAAGVPRSTAAGRARRAGSASGPNLAAYRERRNAQHQALSGIRRASGARRAGARPGLAGPRVDLSHLRSATGPAARPRESYATPAGARCLPGVPRARERYRAAGLVRQLRAATGPSRPAHVQAVPATAGRRHGPAPGSASAGPGAPVCGRSATAPRADRRGPVRPSAPASGTRADRKLCARCRRRAADKQRAHPSTSAHGPRGFAVGPFLQPAPACG